MDDPALTVGYWAGAALATASDTGTRSAVAILALWHRVPAADPHRAERLSRTGAELIDRGFARLPGPGLAAFRALPHLPAVAVRLPGGGRLRIDDGSRTVFEGTSYTASDDWHAAARDGRLTLLVDAEPVPEDTELPPADGDRGAQAMALLAAACRAETVFGARVTVIEGDSTT